MKPVHARIVAATAALASIALAAPPATALTPMTTIGIDHPTVYLDDSTSVSVFGSVTPGAPGHVVYLQSLNSGVWRSVASAKLTDSSHYSFTVRPGLITTYTLRTYDPPTANGVPANVSRAITLTTLRPLVTLTVDHPVLPYYRNPYFSGRVSPSSHDHLVYLQSQRADGTWVSIISRRLADDGSFSIGISAGTLMTYSIRLYDPPTANGYHAAVSPVVHFTLVKPGPPSVSVTTPPDGASYVTASVPDVAFSCAAGAYGTLTECSARIDTGNPIASGTPLDATIGAHTVTVTASQIDGQSVAVVRHYIVTSS